MTNEYLVNVSGCLSVLLLHEFTMDVHPKEVILNTTLVKTADSLIIELNDHSKAILEKYKMFISENHMALPVIQKMNDYLKELGELAEINEPVAGKPTIREMSA